MATANEDVRARILRAAAAEFAERGVAGARVARIAERAQLSKERLYHYVGTKEELFAAVMDGTMARLAEAEPFAARDLGHYVTAMLDVHRREPGLMRLLLTEAAHHAGRPLPRRRHREAHYAARVAAVAEAQAGGGLRSDVDPRVVVYLVLALVATASALPHLTEVILGAHPERPPLGEDDFVAQLRALVDALLAS